MAGRISSDATKQILTGPFLSEKRGSGTIRRFYSVVAFKAFESLTGPPEGCPERGSGRSLFRQEANRDLQKVVFPFHNGIK
jgi:hypothetical protein